MDDPPKRIPIRELAHLIADSIAEDLASFRLAGSTVTGSSQRLGPASPAIGARRAALQNWARRSSSLLSAFLAALSSESFGAPEPGLWAADQIAQSSALQQNLNFLGTFWGALVNRQAPRSEVERQLAAEAAEAVRIAEEAAAKEAGVSIDQYLTSSERDARSLGTLLHHSLSFRFLQARASSSPTCSIALHPHHLIISLNEDCKTVSRKNHSGGGGGGGGEMMAIALGVMGEGHHSAWSVTGLSWGAHGSIGVLKEKNITPSSSEESSSRDSVQPSPEFLAQCMSSLQQSLNAISVAQQRQELLASDTEPVEDRSLSELHAAALDLIVTSELRKSFLLLINAASIHTQSENKKDKNDSPSLQLIRPSYAMLMPRSKRMIVTLWGHEVAQPRTVLLNTSSSTGATTVNNRISGVFHRVPSVLFINSEDAAHDTVINLVPLIRSTSLKPASLFSLLSSISPEDAYQKLLEMSSSLSSSSSSSTLSKPVSVPNLSQSQPKAAETAISSDVGSTISRASVIEEAPVSQLIKDMRLNSKNRLIDTFIGDAASPHLTSLFVSHGTSSFVLGPAPPLNGLLHIDIAQAQSELSDKLSFCHLISTSELSAPGPTELPASLMEFNRAVPKSLIARRHWWKANGTTKVPIISSIKSISKASESIARLQLSCIKSSISSMLDATVEFLTLRPDFVQRAKNLSTAFVAKKVDSCKAQIECSVKGSDTGNANPIFAKIQLSVALDPNNGSLKFEVNTTNISSRAAGRIAQVIASANESLKSLYISKTHAVIDSLCTPVLQSSTSNVAVVENNVSRLVATGSEYVLQSLSKTSSSSTGSVIESEGSTFQLPWNLRMMDNTGRGSHVFGGPLLIERDLSIHSAVHAYSILRSRCLSVLMAPVDAPPQQIKVNADQIASVIYSKRSKEQALLNAAGEEFNKASDQQAWRNYAEVIDSSIRSRPVAGLSEIANVAGAVLPGRASALAKLACESRKFAQRLDAVGTSELASRNTLAVLCAGIFIADALLNTMTEAIECFNFLSSNTETAPDNLSQSPPRVFVFSEETVFLSRDLVPIDASSTTISVQLGRLSELQRISSSLFQYTVSDPRLPSSRKSVALIARPAHMSTTLSIRDSAHNPSSNQASYTVFTFPSLLQLNRVLPTKVSSNTKKPLPQDQTTEDPSLVSDSGAKVECSCEWLPQDIVNLFNTKADALSLPKTFRFVQKNLVSKPAQLSNEGIIYVVELSSISSGIGFSFSSAASFLNRKTILEDVALLAESEEQLTLKKERDDINKFLSTLAGLVSSPPVSSRQASKAAASTAPRKEVRGIIIVDTNQDPNAVPTIFAGLHLTRSLSNSSSFTLPFGILYACSGAASAVIRAANASEASAKQAMQPVAAPISVATAHGMFGSSRTIHSAPKIYNPILTLSSIMTFNSHENNDSNAGDGNSPKRQPPLLVIAAVDLPQELTLTPIKDSGGDVLESSAAKRARIVESPASIIEKKIVQLASTF
jgi:hypothetical protein